MTRPSRSKLLPLGFALMITGIAFSQGLMTLEGGLAEGTYRRIVQVLGDILRLCVILGLALGIVGYIRNRRAMKRER